MTSVAVLPVVVPVLTAAAIAATGGVLPGRLIHGAAIAAAAATTGLCGLLLARSWDGTIVTWFGGWRPRHGIAIGVSFVVDPMAAGLACFAALTVAIVLVYSWHYFDETAALFHTLMLVFLGAMAGFALTGDLFDLFVFFELMSVSAYVLTAYAIDQPAPLQGALGFAITNSIGGILVLLGIALLYGRTGALNLAQIGESLARGRLDALVVTAFALMASGFLVKAAAAPFHFWLADAYGAAPTPICAVFSAVMSDLGLYALARVYWTVFSGPFTAHAGAVRGVLLPVACLTMLVGAAMALLQRHLKRLLAFVTISRGGVFLAGIALLTPKALAGTSVAVLGDGFAKAALFLAVGALAHVLGSADELRLRGRGRRLPLAAAVFAVGGLVVAGLPPFAGWLGVAWIEEAATAAGHDWLRVVVAVSSAVAAGAILRAGLRIFAGVGPAEDPLLTKERDRPEREEPGAGRTHRSPMLIGSLALLLVLALGLGLVPRLTAHAEGAALLVEDRSAYVATVLHARPSPPSRPPPEGVAAGSYVEGGLTVLAALAVAALALGRERIRSRRGRALGAALAPALERLRALHSGRIGDYVAWTTVGTAAIGAVLVAATR